MKKTKAYRPYHAHDEKQMLTPGEIYELDIEIWPQSIILPAGFTLRVIIAGQDFEREGPDDRLVKGSGPWLHIHPEDRPADIFGGKTTLHTGAKHESYILMPVIPN